jgi:small subunit ribosomal protein S11
MKKQRTLKNFGDSKLCTIHINSTQNNTILTARNIEGLVLFNVSIGSVIKSKRGKRSVPQGALLSGEFLGNRLVENGFSYAQVLLKGFGSGRENAIHGLISTGFNVLEIIDLTSLPHNGCRAPKARRI